MITGRTAREIGVSIERGVREGHFSPGEQLPPIRALARELGVSSMTVSSAYRELGRRGVVTGAGRRGTRVSPQPPLPVAVPPLVPAGTRDLARANPDPELLPPLASALARLSPGPRVEPAANKLERLVDVAENHFRALGVPSGALAVVSGALDGIERVLSAHLAPGDKVAVEDPVFSRIIDLVRALGLVPLPVTVDDDGPQPEELAAALAAGASAVIVTPRWQSPFGARVTNERAADLRRVLAGHEGVLLVEDDHAALIAPEPVHSLAQGCGRWAYVGSVTTALGGDYRVALVSGDATTIARVEGRQLLGAGWVSHLLQELVAGLWSDAGVLAALAEAAVVYDTRRRQLLAALAGRGIAAHGASGINLWVPVAAEATTVAGLLQLGWAVSAGERFRLRAGSAIRITTAALTDEEAQALADDIADVLTQRSATYSS